MDPILAAIIAFLATDFGASLAATLTGAALIAIATKIPQATKWARRKINGTRLMVTGPQGVGKTSLIKYFKTGKFQDHSASPGKTTVVELGDGFTWKEKDEKDLSTSDCVDIPGELLPEDQVNEIVKYEPQTLVTVVALNKSGFKQWIEDFCINLASKLQTEKKVRNKLRSFTFVLNKSDTIRDQERINIEKDIQKIINQRLESVFQGNIGRVGLISCTLYKEKGGDKQAAAVALKIALSLAQGGRLING